MKRGLKEKRMLDIKLLKKINIWEIIISIFIIGLINIYLLNINGFNIELPEIILINQNVEGGLGEITPKVWGIIDINERNILKIMIINILFLIIFNRGYETINRNIEIWRNISKIESENSLEYVFLISLGLLGLNLILLSNDLILIFISLELYSLSVYLLILIRISKNSSRMSIIYLLVNSLSSYILLLGISIIYKNSGTIIINEIKEIMNYDININILIGIILIITSILIKLGTVPFNFWVLRLYTSLENRILIYQIIIPKIVYVLLLYKIIKEMLPINGEINIYLNKIYISILIISIISVIIASIAGLFKKNYKEILTYSSILNMGFILIGLINNINCEINKYSFIEYIIIYSVNTLALIYSIILINPESTIIKKEEIKNKTKTYKFNNIYPLLSIFILISIFSFIGIPPFAGFYAKLNIFINIIQSTENLMWEWDLIIIIILLLGTFISACFYLKFIIQFFIKENYKNDINILISNTPISISYYISFLTIFLIFYPFISNYIYPFFLLITPSMC